MDFLGSCCGFNWIMQVPWPSIGPNAYFVKQALSVVLHGSLPTPRAVAVGNRTEPGIQM